MLYGVFAGDVSKIGSELSKLGMENGLDWR